MRDLRRPHGHTGGASTRAALGERLHALLKPKWNSQRTITSSSSTRKPGTAEASLQGNGDSAGSAPNQTRLWHSSPT
jgi:hypothetical protein